MSSPGPMPERFKDCVIYIVKGVRADDMSVIVRPSPYDRVQFEYQVSCCRLFVLIDDLSYFGQQCRYLLLRGFNQELSFVLADILSQQVEAFINVRDDRLFW